jgi:uncharacterized membrane protein YphA (DoxX/SURF4 family)
MVRISFFTCLFLVCLRLVIGWHFFFEGLDKYESLKDEGKETGKPFTSAGYFAEAEGPLGPSIRGFIGDPDAVALSKLTLVEPGDANLAAQMPAALGASWDDYGRQFETFFHLTSEQKAAAEIAVKQAKSDYVLWLTDKKPKDDKDKTDEFDPRKTWIKAGTVGEPGLLYRPEATMTERVATYRKFVDKVRDDYKKILPEMGKDVEQTRLRTLKMKTAEIRTDLMKAVAERTEKMKDSLAKIVDGKLAGAHFGPTEDPKIDQNVRDMLTLNGMGTEATIERMPEALGKQWDEYAAFLHTIKPELDQAAIDQAVKDAKLRYVRFLLDLDPYTGNPLLHRDPNTGNALPSKPLQARLEDYDKRLAKRAEAQKKDEVEKSSNESKAALAAANKDLVAPRQEFIADIRLQTDIFRHSLGGLQAEKTKDGDYDNFKGTVAPPKSTVSFLGRDWPGTSLGWLDWSTRWFLLIGGGCLLAGMFTRLACLGGAAFLAIEILSNTPLPWLPTSPKAEGHYTFINKNVVEFFALMTLLTLPTGRWFGLDAILSCVWPFRSRRAAK